MDITLALRKVFGFGFNHEGKLRRIDARTEEFTDEPYEFYITESKPINEAFYEALAQIIKVYVYELLELNGLFRYYIPSDIPHERASFVFCSFNEIQPVDKLLIIIHENGLVSAGQWSRSLTIKDSLNTGTVLPFIKLAQQHNFDIIVTNTNLNVIDGQPILGSADAKQHAETVVNDIVYKTEAKRIVIIAHAYGCTVTTHLARRFEQDFNEKVMAVVFIDSVLEKNDIPQRLIDIGVNFVPSTTPANTILNKKGKEMEERSAGTNEHDFTPYSCIEQVFDFIREKEAMFT